MAASGDLEAARQPASIPDGSRASASTSTAIEQIELDDQPHLRLRGKGKVVDDPAKSSRPIQLKVFNALQRQLENNDSPRCLFLCWKNGINDERAVLLPVQDHEDDKQIYKNMLQKLYESCGWWWRYLLIYGVTELNEVNVCNRSIRIMTAG